RLSSNVAGASTIAATTATATTATKTSVRRTRRSAGHREFGAYRPRLDARRDRRFYWAKLSLPLQRFEHRDERVVRNGRKDHPSAAFLPIELSDCRSQVLLQ